MMRRGRRADQRFVTLFWTYNAAVKDADGVVRIVGRTSLDQEPPLTKDGKLKPQSQRQTDA
jgi:hypothetical protein